MKELNGIVFAYSASPELGDLVRDRTCASLPFCGRYRLIDFALSSMANAGIRDVGVIMQRDYQSLLDHLGSGKAWDMSMKKGGLRILPPFGRHEYHGGHYSGTMEALNAVVTYVREIEAPNIVLMPGNLCVSPDIRAAFAEHVSSGAGITAVCVSGHPRGLCHRYRCDGSGNVTGYIYDEQGTENEGYASLETYIIRKDVLLEMMDYCRKEDLQRFHRDAVKAFLTDGGRMHMYIHEGYANAICSTDDYYHVSMDMLKRENLVSLFPADRPVFTRAQEGVSTYYGERASSVNSLIADNCIIEGNVENSIIFPGVRVEKGAKVRNCIIMHGGSVGKWADIENVIADKRVRFLPGTVLTGSRKLPTVVPKEAEL